MERCKQCNSLMQIGDSKCRDCGYEENHPRFATLDLDAHDAFASEVPPATSEEANPRPDAVYDATILPGNLAQEDAPSFREGGAARPESRAKQNELKAGDGHIENIDRTASTADGPEADTSTPSMRSEAKLGGTLEMGIPSGPDTAFSIGKAETPKIRSLEFGRQEKPEPLHPQRQATSNELPAIWDALADSKDNPERTIRRDLSLASDEIFHNIAPRTVKASLHRDESRDWNAPSFVIASKLAEQLDSAPDEHADYELSGVLGMGGMGMVFEAQQEAIGREVAIKVIHDVQQPGSSTTRVRQKKFLYEAQITGALDHPNVVPIYDLGVSNDILFYVMKKIEGTEWKTTIAKSSLDENLDIWEKVADALALAHTKKILHRDLKPENVMLGKFGEVYVTDWGCAVDLERQEPLSPAGSPPWMAPEMAVQSTADIGLASDIYLMGAILYQMLVGHPPHPGRTVKECLRTARDNVITEIDDEDPLLDIAFKAMETRPEDRYDNIQAMRADVKLYRKHAESITLCDRSIASLHTGVENQDYEAFSRAIFGFQDAIRLWRSNRAAHDHLKQARLAYGQCAFERGDYDLCLATLDPSISAEGELRQKAEKAQASAAERENRMLRLKKTFAAVVSIALLGLLGLSIYAFQQRSEAMENASEAENQRREALESAKLAKNNAEAAKTSAKLARDKEEEAKKLAISAENARKVADRSRSDAMTSAAEAERRAATVELSNYHSKLALSLEQFRRNDVASGLMSFESLLDREQYPTLQKRGTLPNLRNWATNRIQTLSNQDSITQLFAGQFLKASHSPRTNRFCVALRDEQRVVQIALARLERRRALIEKQFACSGELLDLALAPNGEELVYSVRLGEGDADEVSQSLFLRKLGGKEERLPIEGANVLPRIELNRKWLVGGINSGLWVWSRLAEDWHSKTPKRIRNIRGRLIDARFATEDSMLLLVDLEASNYLHVVDLTNGVSRLVDFAETQLTDFSLTDVTAVGYANGRLLLGLSNGKVYCGVLDLDASHVSGEFRELMPQKHSSAIQSIVSADNGSLLLRSNSPVSSLWRESEAAQGWIEFCSLAGTPYNLEWTGFLDDQEHAVGLSQDGQFIVWDLQDQKQMWRAVPVDQDGEALALNASVNRIAFSAASERATLILNNSSLVSLDLASGKVLSGRSDFAHVGHRPDAELVDFQVSPSAQVLVTSAKLRDGSKSSQPTEVERDSRRTNWEFCKWSLENGGMLDRWERRDAAKQEFSLAHQGAMILYASDEHTLLEEPSSANRREFLSREFGSFFAVPHPKDPFWAMLVKRSGAVRMLDTRQPGESWSRAGVTIDYEQPQNTGLLSDDDRPLCGAWAPGGEQFYMVWTSGRITEFDWIGESLSIKRDLSARELSELISESEPSSFPRLQSKQQVDLKIRQDAGVNRVYLHIRYPASDGKLRLLRISFPSVGSPRVIEDEGRAMAHYVSLNDARTPKPSMEPATRLSLPKSAIIASSSIDELSYLATRDGTVYEVAKDKTRTFGRPKLIGSASSVDGSRIVTLHAGGVLWLGEWNQEMSWNWSQLPPAPDNCDEIALSNDGRSMLIQSYQDDQPIVDQVSIPSGEILQTHNGALAFAWDPKGLTGYAIVDELGKIELHQSTGIRPIGQLEDDRIVKQLCFFEETWEDPEKPNMRWLLVHTENSEGLSHRLEYYPLSPNAQAQMKPLQLGDNSSLVACEPEGGVFAVGGQGTLAFYWATPTHGVAGAEVFSLSGHAGSKVVALAFSPDGKYAVSADEAKRCFIWRAAD